MSPNETFLVQVNGRPAEARRGETLLDVCRHAGVDVPTLCHMPGLAPSGACRICVVDVRGRGLVPSCSCPVEPGMSVETNSQSATRARKTIVELLLANHPDDCLYCVRHGECELQDLAQRYGVRERRYVTAKNDDHVDVSSPSLVRDPAKCILCGKCVRVCEEVMGVAAIDFIRRGSHTLVAPAFNRGLNVSTCINCGQCVMVCPTGALREKSHLKEVQSALDDPAITVVVQHAPAVSVSLAEEFGLEPGADVEALMVTALRRLGFARVFDTSFAADLTIMEEASELVSRLKGGGRLPMFTSCSPGWVKFVEQSYPDLMPNLSTCKSPQQMMGAVVKRVWAAREGLDPRQVFSVAIMPCTAKKFEARRPEMGDAHDVPDVDAVLTTRELARLIRLHGLDLARMTPGAPDQPFGERSTAGKMFGGTGGVMEAALRTAHWLVTGREMYHLTIGAVRGLDGIKEARIKLDDVELGVAVVSGLGRARRLLEEIRAGRDDLHFIEVMTCPGGCVGGGGQPLRAEAGAVRGRLESLYRIDRSEPVRLSHRNRQVQELYDEVLGEPLGARSHELLHTGYHGRDGAA
ncbi:MAG: NADH-dependent [FeFe] hydrogenase, group A6 [Candidatus Latescibacteria bacterium]|nr:NADH-dependent [FeFe] hydrogenase, group A6 [Candidatus Latescibacterota bacterium]